MATFQELVRELRETLEDLATEMEAEEVGPAPPGIDDAGFGDRVLFRVVGPDGGTKQEKLK